MLQDLIDELIRCLDENDISGFNKTMKNLEKLGVDRNTACVMLYAVLKEKKSEATS